MSKGSSGGTKATGTQTVTNRTELPGFMSEALEFGTGKARELYDQGQPELYPENTTIPFSQQTEDSLQGMETLARSAFGVDPAMTEYNRTLGGDYLAGGPGFNAAYQAASDTIVPQVQSAFARSGRTNSGLAQEAQTRALGNAFASLYDNERNRQQGALGMAPGMANLAYQPAAQLLNVGRAREEQAGRDLAEKIGRYEYEQQAPYTNLDQFLNRVQGVAPFSGSTSIQTNPLYTNRAASMLGTLGMGLGLANQAGVFGGGGGSAANAGLSSIFGGGLLG
jgi:hypothetical protein